MPLYNSSTSFRLEQSKALIAAAVGKRAFLVRQDLVFRSLSRGIIQLISKITH